MSGVWREFIGLGRFTPGVNHADVAYQDVVRNVVEADDSAFSRQ